jgi:Spy/CpxP family protein refolding chaperone
MRGRRWRPAILSVVLGLLLASPYMVQAQPDAARQKQDPFEMYRQVGASSEQIAQMKSLVEEFTEQQKVRGQGYMKLINDMQALSLQPDPDSDAVMAKQDEINKAGNEMASAKLRLMLKMRAVLTPEQKAQWVKLLQAPASGQNPVK